MTNLSSIYGRVYLITNKVNGKVYVGQTTRFLKNRLRNHISHAYAHLSGKYKGQDTPLFRAIRKYGKESFIIDVICSCSSKEELDLMEDLYIAILGGMDKRTGYNVRRGGSNGKMSEEVKLFCGSTHLGRKHTSEARQKMSVAMKESIALNPRPPVSEETRKKMSVSQKKRKRIISPETTEKLRNRFLGEKGTSYIHEVDTQELVRLYELGYSCKDISKSVPMTEAGVRTRLRSSGVKMRTPWSKVRPASSDYPP